MRAATRCDKPCGSQGLSLTKPCTGVCGETASIFGHSACSCSGGTCAKEGKKGLFPAEWYVVLLEDLLALLLPAVTSNSHYCWLS